ncbi:FAD-dependent monooxygenase [Stenotrophomonas sp. 24(2023)]|uniref:FAD-dependent monooxygenase n=1 Tax=Stenotrophomonas sp. 24(2023) TaxID=3068324 RepID=UPI0027E0BD87|nr:FAD-dependent monooxygenase [Stenotrophomonas sp. 24(2023)]WMJ71495.1 FAD-dependent monooxygenase [Stenotrophomonas sp. 24(2023)]
MKYDVVVAGAGPVGLLLACELRLGGCSVLVLEQAEDPESPLKRLPFGLRGLNAPTLDALDRRGLLAPLQALQPLAPKKPDAPVAAHWLLQKRASAGHFAGLQFYLDNVDATRWPWRQAGPGGNQMPTDMASIEQVLAARAAELGVQVRRGYAVHAVDATADGVRVQAGGQVFNGRWLVGCDGARSVVRKACGFAVEGTAPEFTGYSIEAALDDAALLQPGRHFTETGMYTFTPPSMIALVDFDGGRFHRNEPTVEHVQAVLRRVSGTAVGIGVLRQVTTWTDRALQATCYRQGRVLLAGDAAHMHSPLGGQGLNLGLGDAMNLGWKLAAVVRGDHADTLLDSYAEERHPLGAAVLEWSRAQVALMRPDPGIQALRTVVAALADSPDGASYFAERVWGVGQQYAWGAGHAWCGRSAPDIAFADGSRLGEHLRTGQGLLITFGPQSSLLARLQPWADRVAACDCQAVERFGLQAMLVRPDGIVAWAAEEGALEEAALHDALVHWFGVPSAAVHPAAG